MSVVPPSNLVSADMHDFVPNNPLWVRGREAICTRFDYPHVYWHFNDDQAILEAAQFGLNEPIVKHRSFTCTPDIFQVESSRKRTSDGSSGGSGGNSQNHHHQNQLEEFDPDTSDEDEEHESRHAQQHDQSGEATSQSSDSDSSSSSSSTSTAPSPVDSNARNSLMSMFSKRPGKEIVSKINDAADQVIQAASPQSVNIEHCNRSRFRIPHKITSLNLNYCEDVEVEFQSVISAVELFNCKRCTLRCAQSTSTFNLENTDSCTLLFPASSERVLFVSLKANSTQLVATPTAAATEGEGESATTTPATEEVRFTIDENSVEVIPSPAPSSSDPAESAAAAAAAAANQVPTQFRTLFQKGAFTTEVLQRTGTIGYFNNNA